jgi:hypothetical protein
MRSCEIVVVSVKDVCTSPCGLEPSEPSSLDLRQSEFLERIAGKARSGTGDKEVGVKEHCLQAISSSK